MEEILEELWDEMLEGSIALAFKSFHGKARKSSIANSTGACAVEQGQEELFHITLDGIPSLPSD